MTSGSTPRPEDTAVPASIGDRYRVERVLGRGGMATVYLCNDERTGEKVAVKVLREELGSAVVVERFLREIEFASGLDHERIPKVLDSGVTGELPFYVMTYIEGESLRQRLDRVKQLPVDEAVRITNAVIEPMTYAHRLGIVHRDIKPGNIIVGEESVHVLDFGIARAILFSADERLTSTGVALGTPAYMSPEQALADGDLDARSDIYSLGCVAYEMIAGIPPFVGATPQAVMARRFASPPSPLRETREGVPPQVDRAVAKALSRAPADRWQTAREFGDALSASEPSESMHEVSARVDQRRRTYGRLIVGTLAAALLAGIGIVAFTIGRDPIQSAESALEALDFEKAEADARKALADDPSNPSAHLLLARSLNLLQRPRADWIAHVRIASERAQRLLPGNEHALKALSALAAGDRGAACQLFEQNSASEHSRSAQGVAAAIEYADCLVRDSLVIRASSSESGYFFRSSYARADSVYSDLLDRNPTSARVFRVTMPRLETVLPTHKGIVRTGNLPGDSRMMFRALPSIDGDTIAFVPYPLVSGRPWTGGDAIQVDHAIQQNRGRLRGFTQRWVSLDPENADSHAAASRILESLGILDGEEGSALGEIRLARHYQSRTASADVASFLRHVRLGLDHVRISLRLAQFGQAGAVADSILAVKPPRVIDDASSDTAAALLANLDAIRGRPLEVMRHGRRFAAQYPARAPGGERVMLPPSVGGDLIRLDAYAAFGGNADSISVLANRIEAGITALMPASYSAALSRSVLSRPLSLAAPVAGTGLLIEKGEHNELYARALIARSRGDNRRSRAYLDSLDALHSRYAPGEITMDVVFTEAWLKAALGDTASAVRELDNALRGIAAALPPILRNPTLAAFFVRAMGLRAELARAAGDSAGAAYWGNAVISLWGNGDAVVAPTVEQARRARR